MKAETTLSYNIKTESFAPAIAGIAAYLLKVKNVAGLAAVLIIKMGGGQINETLYRGTSALFLAVVLDRADAAGVLLDKGHPTDAASGTLEQAENDSSV